jgi:hypothetical protein
MWLYQLFKYAVYALLGYDVWLFFLDDLSASAEIFTDGVTWHNFVEAYSATVDTAAWVVLLLLFELETAVIPDKQLRGRLQWILNALLVACYAIITYSFYGYVVKLGVVTDLAPFAIADVCSLIGSDFTWVSTLDEYLPLTLDSCAPLQGASLQQIVGTKIIGAPEALELARNLAITDVVNAATWLLVVAVLEADVQLQLRQQMTRRLNTVGLALKAVLYTILLGCAVYWGIEGSFIDFWDAFLWLVAFVFIEMNFFEWQNAGQGRRNRKPEPWRKG